MFRQLPFLFTILILLLCIPCIHALDFAILNKGDIIFQEIFIENPEEGNNYYHNFGIDGLEPGARHNIHLYSTKDILICSFYLYGISQESYVIEDVAIEENSIVYILPEHYRENPDSYADIDNPDAVYGARPIDRDSLHPLSEALPPVVIEPVALPLKSIEVFNYTNSPVFRAYLDTPDAPGEEDYLKGEVLKPSESLTLELPLEESGSYQLRLVGADSLVFTKGLQLPLEADFVVFDDSDSLKDYDPILIEIENGSHEEIVQLFIVDQETSYRKEILKEKILKPLEKREILLDEDFGICDIIARTAGKKNIYILDHDLNEDSQIIITDF